MMRDCVNTGPRPGEVLKFGAKRMLRTSVYAYESNEVYFARLCVRLYKNRSILCPLNSCMSTGECDHVNHTV